MKAIHLEMKKISRSPGKLLLKWALTVMLCGNQDYTKSYLTEISGKSPQ